MTSDDLTEIRRDLHQNITWTDEFMDGIVFRLTALEEIVAARWPRSILVRHRLAKAIRASVAEIDGPDFTAKRLNTIATGWRDHVPPWDTKRRKVSG